MISGLRKGVRLAAAFYSCVCRPRGTARGPTLIDRFVHSFRAAIARETGGKRRRRRTPENGTLRLDPPAGA
jgi:hypothetical protein